MTKVVTKFFDTYLAVVKNSVGSNLFRNYYAEIDGVKKDIMDDGVVSCAFFVSSILTMLGLIKKTHGTVDGVVFDLIKSGWKKIRKPKVGSVLVWEEIKFKDGTSHKHLGFYIGNEKAISNNSESGTPTIHHWTLGANRGKAKRKIDAIYWHKKLE